MFERIKNIFSWLKTKITGSKVTRKKEVTTEDREKLDAQQEKARGMADARAEKAEQKYNELKRTVEEREEFDVEKELTQEKRKLQMGMFENATSIKKFMRYSDNNNVYIRNADSSKIFGIFKDLLVLPDGRVSLTKEGGDGVSPVITGRTFKDILRNINLKTVATTNTINVNLNEEGEFVENLESKKVPDIVIDEEGNFITTKAHTEKLQKLLAQKQKQINKWRNEAKTSEQAWIGENQEKKALSDVKDVIKTRADKGEDDFQDAINSAKEIIMNDNIMNRAMQDIINDKVTVEQLNKQLYSHRNELQKKVSSLIDKNEKDLAKEDIQDLSRWILNSITPEATRMKEKKIEAESKGGSEE